MSFQIFDQSLVPAEAEAVVKTYHCTSMKSRMLNLKAEGHLVVTNKRVIFHASGSSYGGDSVLQSEVPIEDVSGMNLYKGNYFSLSHFLSALFISFILGSLVSAIVGALLTAVVGNNIRFDNYQEMMTSVTVVVWLLGLAAIIGSFFIKSDKMLRSILATTGALILGAGSGLSLLGNFLSMNRDGSQLQLLVAVAAIIYAIVCFFLYARRVTMSLAVGSKGGSSTPIAISGVSSFSSTNTGALRALSAEPAEDADDLIKELGALVLDIQKLGDYGIQKWQVR